VDNTMLGSFFSTPQLELLDRQSWALGTDLASAISDGIEAWCIPRRPVS